MVISIKAGYATRELAPRHPKGTSRRRTRRPVRSADRRAAIRESLGGAR